ncbi:hypothetical protein NM688_g1020 [Phlebia brevispora]|uniref:Uncharacterized protein n=1 Tax=Phlebia brevispora TaxID=194682 RepID=A0ACC1TCJ1_9APHY|nr:hypothetical protein NM688_g1020 [Phlebia brevispora]
MREYDAVMPSEQPLPTLKTPQGDAIQISVSHFLSGILPPLRNGIDAATVVDTLLHTGNRASRPISSTGRWRGFPNEPMHAKGTAKQVFRPLENIVRSILETSGVAKSSLSLYINSRPTESEDRHQEFLPDVYLSNARPGSWQDIVAFGELKKKAGYEDVRDNVNKVTNSMTKCMYNDPRRRFVFAFTIDNANMRLWFCDRARIWVSAPFNFITDHIPVVHFFLSLIYADPADIGLDPTMIPLGDGRHYDIMVRSNDRCMTTYRTVDVLFSGSPEVLCYKGTRAWKARKVVDGQEVGEPVVLKDSWISASRPPEAVVLEKVRKVELPTELKSEADAAFLTVECYGDVYLTSSDGDALDCTRLCSQDYIHYQRVKSRAALDDTNRTSDTGVPAYLVHHRVVFKEVCKTLEEETSLTAILRALARIALVLQAMHSDGWIHRDISSRNILVRDDGVALLGDLEYTKKIGKEDEIRVGTPDYIAAEVAEQDYNFTLFPGGCIPPAVLKTYPEKCEAAKDKMPARGESRKRFPFRYNPLHDLESLWWTAVYFLVNKEIVLISTPGGPMAPDESPTEFGIANFAHGAFATELFLNRNGRRNCLSLPNRFMDRFSEAGFHECLYPSHIESIGSGAASGLHQIFHDALQVVADVEGYDKLIVRGITYISPENYLARMKAFASPSPSPSPKPANERGSPSSSEWSSEDGSVSGSSSKRRRISTYEDDLPVLPERPEISKRLRPYLQRRAKNASRGQVLTGRVG